MTKINQPAGFSTTDISLNENSILNAVRQETNLVELHEKELDDRLRRLLLHMDNDLGLNGSGKLAAFRSVVEILKSRAHMLDDRERYPEIKDEVIEKPIIVVGLPRSGTTVMHALLSADPDNRAPRYWEAVWPSPPPGISPDDDPRIARGDIEVAELCRQNPLILKSHPYWDAGANTIMECEAFGGLDLRNVYNTYYFRVPAMLQIELMDDPVGYFKFHKSVLQNLQWQRPRKRWALKGNEHYGYLGALQEVYPDGIVIWLHRDPYKVVPSLMELLFNWFQDAAGKPLHRPTVGRQVLALYKNWLDKGVASPAADYPNVHHLLFTDFMGDPVGEIGKAYKKYGLPFGDKQREAMRSWLDDPKNAGDRYGKFTYSLDDFEMGRDEIDTAFAAYRARFGVAQEK